MIVYKNCKKLIENDRYEYDDMLSKLDMFLIADRITIEQYKELKDLMDIKKEIV